jgi:phosphoglycolate phosphatase
LKNLFFDLDGTLTHSHEGIIRCINHALLEAGAGPRSDAELRPFLGPPLREAFAVLLDTTDDARVERAVRAYRIRFEAVGMFENAVCAGIPAALEALSRAGYGLHVVTVKPTVYARRILEHFALDGFFRSICGSDLDGRGDTKSSLIRDALRETAAEPRSTAMIGDRGEDIAGARSNGVYAVAAAWGYGDVQEFRAAGADLVVSSPAELVSHFEK